MKTENTTIRRRITVSVIGASLPPMPSDHHPTATMAIRHWQQAMQSELSQRPDLMVFPEVCDFFKPMTPTEKHEYLRQRGDQVLDFFRQTARNQHCYIVFDSYRVRPEGGYANSAWLLDRQGNVTGVYDKNYLTAGEFDFGVIPGAESPVFTTDFGTLAMVICFDLNFTELLERYAAQKPDILAFSSYYHGGLMQPYWAFRCRAHFLGSTVGTLESTILNPVGERLKYSTCYYKNITASINTNCAVLHLDGNMEKLQAAIDRYPGIVHFSDPGNLGCVLLTSEEPELTIPALIREFGFELFDDYYTRSSMARNDCLRKHDVQYSSHHK